MQLAEFNFTFFHSRKALQKALGQVPPFPHGERPIPMLFGALE